jgi:hypothetical protein
LHDRHAVTGDLTFVIGVFVWRKSWIDTDGDFAAAFDLGQRVGLRLR